MPEKKTRLADIVWEKIFSSSKPKTVDAWANKMYPQSGSEITGGKESPKYSINDVIDIEEIENAEPVYKGGVYPIEKSPKVVKDPILQLLQTYPNLASGNMVLPPEPDSLTAYNVEPHPFRTSLMQYREILSAPAENIKKRANQVYEQSQKGNIGAALLNYLTGIGETAISPISTGFELTTQVLRDVGMAPVAKAIELPFEAAAEGVIEGQKGIDKVIDYVAEQNNGVVPIPNSSGQTVPIPVEQFKNLGLNSETAREYADALTDATVFVSQLLAGGLVHGGKSALEKSMGAKLNLREVLKAIKENKAKKTIKDLLNQEIENIQLPPEVIDNIVLELMNPERGRQTELKFENIEESGKGVTPTWEESKFPNIKEAQTKAVPGLTQGTDLFGNMLKQARKEQQTERIKQQTEKNVQSKKIEEIRTQKELNKKKEKEYNLFNQAHREFRKARRNKVRFDDAVFGKIQFETPEIQEKWERLYNNVLQHNKRVGKTEGVITFENKQPVNKLPGKIPESPLFAEERVQGLFKPYETKPVEGLTQEKDLLNEAKSLTKDVKQPPPFERLKASISELDNLKDYKSFKDKHKNVLREIKNDGQKSEIRQLYNKKGGELHEKEYEKRVQKAREESEKSRLETEKLNKQFKESAEKEEVQGRTPEEIIADKIADGDKLTPEELKIYEETQFAPEGYKYDVDGSLVKLQAPPQGKGSIEAKAVPTKEPTPKIEGKQPAPVSSPKDFVGKKWMSDEGKREVVDYTDYKGEKVYLVSNERTDALEIVRPSELENVIKVDQINKTSRDKSEKVRQEEVAEQQKQKELENDLLGFEKGKTGLELGRTSKILNRDVRYENKSAKRKDMIADLVNRDYEITNENILRKKGDIAGYQLNKTEGDFARFLIDKKPKAELPSGEIVKKPTEKAVPVDMQIGKLLDRDKFLHNDKGVSHEGIELVGNFNKKKLADFTAKALGGEVYGYLYGKYKRGWYVTRKPTSVKEPWEMNMSELQKFYDDYNKKNENPEYAPTDYEIKTMKEIKRLSKKPIDEIYPDIENAAKLRRKYNNADKWAGLYRKALSEGKPVPEEVLKDYPELTKTVKTEDVTEKVIPKTEESELIKEAKKYESAEEFVESQKKYHGTPLSGERPDFEDFELGLVNSREKIPSNAFYFTSNEFAAGQYGDIIKERFLKMENPFDLTTSEKQKDAIQKAKSEIQDIADENGVDFDIKKVLDELSKEDAEFGEKPSFQWLYDINKKLPTIVRNGIVKWAKDKGYDSAKMLDSDRDGNYIADIVFDASQILKDNPLKSQLTDIWNKANKRPKEAIIPETIEKESEKVIDKAVETAKETVSKSEVESRQTELKINKEQVEKSSEPVTKDSPIEVKKSAKKASRAGYASLGHDLKKTLDKREQNLGRSPSKDVVKPDKRLVVSERVKQIFKDFDISINERTLARKHEGLYKKRSKNVRVQSLFNVTTTVHEATHALSDRHGIAYNVIHSTGRGAKTRKLLTDVYEEYYPGAKRSHDLNRRIEEGLAVLIEEYYYDPKSIKTKYPELVKDFINPKGRYYHSDIGKLLDKMDLLSEDYAKLPAHSKMGARIKRGIDIIKDRKKGFTFRQKPIFALFNIYEPVARMSKKEKVRHTWDDPVVQAFNMLNKNSIVTNWVLGNNTPILRSDGQWVNLKGSVSDYTKLIAGKEIEFDEYLVARRVVENHNKLMGMKEEYDNIQIAIEDAKKQGIDPSKVLNNEGKPIVDNPVIKSYEKLLSIIENDNFNLQEALTTVGDYNPIFGKPVEIYDAINKRLVIFAKNTGLIKPEIADLMLSEKGYASFQRYISDELSEGINAISTSSQVKPRMFKARKGSQLDIISPSWTQLNAINEIISKGMENLFWNRVYDLTTRNSKLAERFEKIETITAVQDDGKIIFPQDRDPNLIRIFREGKRLFVKPAPEIAAMAKAMRPKELETFGQILRIPASVFTRLTTSANPFFSIGNATIDQISQTMNTKTGAIPVIDPVKNVVDFIRSDYEKELFNKYLSIGGKRQTMAAYHDLSPEDVMKRLAGNESKLQKVGKVIDVGLGILELPSNYSEYLSRFNEFKRAIKQGKNDSEAMYLASQVTTPFQLHGSFGGQYGQEFVRSIPYLNATLQVAYKHGLSIAEQPKRVFAVTAGIIAAGITSSIAIMSGSSDAQKRLLANQPARELARAIFFSSPNGEDLIRIRIPEQIGSILAPVELYIFSTYGKNKVTYNDYLDAVTAFVPDQINILKPGQIPFSLTPQAIKPSLLVAANKKTYPELAPIVPPYLEMDSAPKNQYTAYTSKIGKFTGQLLDVSPMKVDYLIRNQMGAVGGMFIGKFPNNPLYRQEGEYAMVGRAYNNFYENKEFWEQKKKELKDENPYNEEEKKEIIGKVNLYNNVNQLFSKMRKIMKDEPLPENIKQSAYELLLAVDEDKVVDKEYQNLSKEIESFMISKKVEK